MSLQIDLWENLPFLDYSMGLDFVNRSKDFKSNNDHRYNQKINLSILNFDEKMELMLVN